MKTQYDYAMSVAVECAREASVYGDVPVGAVVLDETGQIIARGYNRRQALNDPFSHAEIEAIREAAKIRQDWNFAHCTVVVTLEPCPMCAGAMVSAHVGNIVFGAWDDKLGACGSVWDIARDPHVGFRPQVYGGVRVEECAQLLSEFFANKRE